MKFAKLAALLTGASIASMSVLAQQAAQPQTPLPYHYTLPLSIAVEAAQEALRVCEQNRYWSTVTVVDMDGIPQVVLRGDHAPVATGESSFRKAFTVITLGPEFGFDRSSGFFELFKRSQFAPQLATVKNVIALPGAVAFKVHGEIVGALGIGGAPGGDKDEVCAAAGVAKVADRLPQ
ncbi:heme-binding protein [Caballeronia novacaledonica]|uniref:GlcG/HbpS family heme-binding protein n=1 Tax=Caballeronia novacaledonica TaxID=1544861 RepID=UPI001EE1FC8D|nr:heme-binding protein [Caballeronia novacaledonica]GJH13276.1 heme-binding protein [Caballeronia novacaledonica]